MSAVQKLEAVPANTSVVAITPMDMLDRAVQSGAGIEVISKFMDLQDRWEKTQARKSFDAAVAQAKAEIPVIGKNATGHNNKRYADFAAIARAVDPILGKLGLGYRFRTVQDDKFIRTTCVLFHKDGHAEENTLVGPADASGSKNAIQAIGSTLTYLQRYSLVQALGLAATDDDDAKAGGSGETLNDEQIANIRALIVEVAADIPRFCRFMKVERIEDIPARKYVDAVRALESKRVPA